MSGSFRDWYRRRVAARLCVGCPAPATHGVHCAGCAERNRAEKQERYLMLRAAGLCIRCKADAGPFSKCAAHRAEHAAKQRQKRAA